MQFATIGILLIALQLIFLDYSELSFWLLLIPTLAAVIYQIWWILPYTRIYPPEVSPTMEDESANHLKIITANVLMTNKHAEKLIDLVGENSPDILVTLETNAWWENALKKIEKDYPYRMGCPLENLYGMHVYSRYKLSDCKIEFLVENDVPSMHALLTMPSGQDIRIHFLHPAPPSPTENSASAERDAELIMIAKSVVKSDLPVIVTGDLNDVAWSFTTRLFRKISGLLDPRIGRGMFNTFHADYWFMRWPLDHLFHSSDFKLYDMRRLSRFGSDHFALFTQLVLVDPQSKSGMSGLTADKEDKKFANKKMASEDVSENDVPNHRQ